MSESTTNGIASTAQPRPAAPLAKAPAPVALATAPVGKPPARQTKNAAATCRDELEVLIRARYAVIYVVSWEEARVEAHLAEIAKRRGKEFHTWSITAGLRKAGGNSPQPARRGISDPLEALDAVIEHKEAAIYFFKDLHALLRPAVQCNIPTIRKVRDVARSLSDSYKTLVICAPQMEMAPELQKDIAVVDYPLPEASDLDQLLRKICDDVAAGSNRPEADLSEHDREELVRAAGGLTLQEAENVFAKTIVTDGRLSGSDVSTVFAEKQQIVRKSGLLEYYDSTEKLEDVGGMEQLKDWLQRRSMAFTEKARLFGLPEPKGVLLVGVQGCGKSLCAKAVSRAWNMPLLRFDVGRLFSSLVGSSEENMRRAIAVAESIAPAVMWIDEIDKAFSGSGSSGSTDGGTTARVMSTFLTWLSEKTKPVFVLATANDISQLPPELLRKGRLDEIFFVDLPSAEERATILRIHLAKRKRNPANYDLAGLALAADGFSGAEIEQGVISALYDAFYMGREVATDDILRSIRETVPLSRTMSEKISGLRAWAEGRARFASKVEGGRGQVRRKIELDSM